MIDVQHDRTEPECQGPAWNLWGYGWSSSGKQEDPPEVQAEKLAKAAIVIQPDLRDSLAGWVGSNIFIDDATSDRKRFQELMARVQPGDHLVIQQWGQLDPNPVRCVGAVRERGLHLHVLQYGEAAIDLHHPIEALVTTIFAGFGGFENAQRTEASVSTKRHLKARGAYRHGMPMPGYKLIWRRNKRSYQHDEAERVLIRELGARVYWGEMRGEKAVRGIRAVCKDFKQRGEVTANGKPWSEARLARRWPRRCWA